MENLNKAEKIVKENLKVCTDVGNLKEIKTETKNLEAIKIVKKLFEQREQKMRTEEEMKEKLQWLIKAVDDEENQTELMQAKLYAQIDIFRWLGVKP